MMNIRIMITVGFIVLIAIVTGIVNFNSEQGISLEEASDNNIITIKQISEAGTIPHTVEIVNTGSKTVNVETGTILHNYKSQDLSIIGEDIILPGEKKELKAYCIEPEIVSGKNKKLIAMGTAPKVITHLISTSNPDLNTQLQIWILTSGPDFNIEKGECLEIIKNDDLSYSELKNNTTTAKITVMTKYNFTETEIDNMNLNNSLLNKSVDSNSFF